MNFTDYNFYKNSYIVLSMWNNQWRVINFKIDAINLRDNHERHEAMESAVTIMTKLNENNILNAIKIIKNINKFMIFLTITERCFKIVD